MTEYLSDTHSGAGASVLTSEAEYHSPPLEALSFRFMIHGNEPLLGEYLETLLSSLAGGPSSGGPGDVHHYAVVGKPGGDVDLFRDEIRIAQLTDAWSAVAWLLWDLNQEVVRSTADCLLFHAGGLQSGDTGILLPAPSGSGKSTLVTALVRAGLGHLSDELVAFNLMSERLLPFPKPITLKSGSFHFFEALRPLDAPGPVAGPRGPVAEWFIRPDDIRWGSVGSACPPEIVVAPRYVTGAPTTLRSLSPDEAFLALALNTVNLDRVGADGARVLGNLVERCACYELVMSDPSEAAELVLGLLGEGGSRS
ncbi:MAG TPA: hypothetical protein VNG12_22395 [Acidimicrobiales bacterium]|nr:hypothetical protein [Acidimicrobiales bacterium]